MKKLLIANRGEIACRVIRAAREMGILTVAVYSDADENAMHVRMADEAVALGGSEPSESYLSIEKILKACVATSADAVHPGYGFLSERAEFVDACSSAGITFVGPSSQAMRALGAKIEAKQIAVSAGVPITPGFFEPGASVADLKNAANEIGYPVMLKASAGGGGRGMRIVRDVQEFDSACQLAIDEAVKGFGDGAMMVEKLIERPRHIEVQVLADQHGNVACLFERECSLQRRHQKIIEEAPSPIMTDDLWQKMRASCISLVEKAEYTGAGTVEFMLDESSGEFYFLEVNARLQVEHPVTEAITGLDLVQWQLRIAQGEKLELPAAIMAGDRSAIRGHSIEIRVVAEDPANGFMPSIGKIIGWAKPEVAGVRFDTGFETGAEVTRFYDSLIAKLITHGSDRTMAIRKALLAIEDTHILGVKTNLAYVADVMKHSEFVAGNFDTGFLGREFGEWAASQELPLELADLILAASSTAAVSGSTGEGHLADTAWGLSDGFRNVPV